MKKKAVFICVLMILAIFLFACCGTGNEAEIEKKAEIEDKIIDYYNENNVKIREDEIICNKLTKETYLKYAFKYFKELTNEFTDIFTKSNRTSRK